MDLPIDIKTVLKQMTDVNAAREVPITVSVLLDDAAPADLVAFVRTSYASASPQAHVSINYFHDDVAFFDEKSDMAVIAAGPTASVGRIANRVRLAGIPALVVTSSPTLVKAQAADSGYPVPEGDLVAPEVRDGDVVMFSEPITVSSEGSSADVALMGAGAFEPFTLDDERRAFLSRRMGEWVVATFRDKKLAFAQAFTFVRKPLALDAVNATSVQNAGVGLVVVLPGADMPVMTANQAKMALEIAAAYGQPLTAERVKELAAVVGGAFACRTAARQLVAVVPGLGWAIKAGIGYGGTKAMGHAIVEFFENGGTVSGVASALNDVRVKAVDGVKGLKEDGDVKGNLLDRGKAFGKRAARKVKDGAKNAPDAVKETAKAAGRAALDAIPGVSMKESR